MQLLGGYHYIPVSNLQRSAEWYSDHLGFKLVFEDPLYLELRSESGIRIILITNEDNVRSHMTYSNGPQAAYGFIVSNIESTYQQFIEKGIKIGRISNYQGTSFGFHDPDGNIIELWSDYPTNK
ncbi:VOC family protein [Cohnella silvisoli]|uniref:VOC family protein n=1 Tax=Cohnella silvisoli TaxID=2873699 RepID=A0ABV1L197_9BACL|nr:VOC family protein [Cohnella silvisoli]MCD9025477.1 VOC family protein [Cohnella silvisoli]